MEFSNSGQSNFSIGALISIWAPRIAFDAGCHTVQVDYGQRVVRNRAGRVRSAAA